MRPISDVNRITPSIARHRATRFTFLSSHAGAQRGRRLIVLITLTSACGFIAWLSLTLLTTGSPAAPGMSLVSQAFTQWRSGDTFGGLSHTSGYVSEGRPQLVAPLQCDSSGTSSVGSDLFIPPTEVICGDVLVIGANIIDQGEVRGSIQVIGGSAVISGSVTGDITVIGGNIAVQSGGKVYGAARAIGGAVNSAPGAAINNAGDGIQGPRDLTYAPGLNVSIDVGSFWLGLLFWISAALGLSALAPEMIGHVRSTVSHHFALSGIVGALLALAAVIVSVALVFTCLGIPLALAIAIAAWFAWVVGTVGIGAWLGAALFGGLRGSHAPSLIISAILGVVILCLLKAIPIIGPIVGLLTGAIALGGSILTLLSARRVSYVRPR